MHKNSLRRSLVLNTSFTFTVYACLLFMATGRAEIYSEHLSVISSANPQSNSVQSFIIINSSELIQEGIKHSTRQQLIGQQTPFVIRFTKSIEPHLVFQWKIRVLDKQHGSIKMLSDFKGSGRILNSGYVWQSENLTASIKDRQQLVFRPKPFAHQPATYKKGKGPQGKRSKYGGGTRNIDEKKYNPKFSYDITLNILQNNEIINSHKVNLSMDRIDMIRQEYINHYNISRYGRGKNGNIPVPKREEIINIPEQPEHLEGNPLTESKYKLIINDGMQELASKISHVYTQHLNQLKSDRFLLDLKQNKLNIPDNELWVSSGWRNPERNEWYSNAVNGIHQRGGAVDFIIKAPANSIESAIGYWILWQALQNSKADINAYWQLETNGRPMTTKEFKQDIEPENGIPDAFDKADHLHANIHY